MPDDVPWFPVKCCHLPACFVFCRWISAAPLIGWGSSAVTCSVCCAVLQPWFWCVILASDRLISAHELREGYRESMFSSFVSTERDSQLKRRPLVDKLCDDNGLKSPALLQLVEMNSFYRPYIRFTQDHDVMVTLLLIVLSKTRSLEAVKSFVSTVRCVMRIGATCWSQTGDTVLQFTVLQCCLHCFYFEMCVLDGALLSLFFQPSATVLFSFVWSLGRSQRPSAAWSASAPLHNREMSQMKWK